MISKIRMKRHCRICVKDKYLDNTFILNLNLNLNSLLVKRQIDNPSPGAVTGGN